MPSLSLHGWRAKSSTFRCGVTVNTTETAFTGIANMGWRTARYLARRGLTSQSETLGEWNSAHFQRDQISAASGGFVIRGNRAVTPFAGKIVGANEKQRFVVRGAELQRTLLGVDGKNRDRSLRAVDGNQASSHKLCSRSIAGIS